MTVVVKQLVQKDVNLLAITTVTQCVPLAVMTLVPLLVTLDAKRLVTQHVQMLVKVVMVAVKQLVQTVVKVVMAVVSLLVQKVVKDVYTFVDNGCDD